MSKAEQAALSRHGLTNRLDAGTIASIVDRPPRGWVRAIRDALGMTGRQLAARMNVSQPTITQLERSEATGVIGLDTLRRAADALGCDLVYALIPRSSLDDIVRQRARLLARHDLAHIDRSMRLEDQSLDRSELDRRVDGYAERLIAAGRLWDEPPGR